MDGGAAAGRVASTVTIIEDEPPHEFYASLLGLKVKATPRKTRITPESSSASLVPYNDSPPRVAQPVSTSVYARALSNPPQLSSLSLDASNKGFTLLSRMGWNEADGGLGRRRQGSLQPLTTILKKDKKGLGAGRRNAPRITHVMTHGQGGLLQHDDTPKETKGQRKRRLRQERDKEASRAKRVRMLLRTDVSDQYESLYMQLHSM